MLQFESYSPIVKLQKYIKAYWFIKSGTQLQLYEKIILAHDDVCITFVLHDDLSKSDILIYPASQKSYHVKYQSNTSYIDISLRAGVFFNLFHIPICSLNHKIIEVSDLSLSFDYEILKKLHSLKNDKYLILKELNNFFLNLFSKNFNNHDYTLMNILAFSKHGNIDTFCQSEQMSMRQIQRITQQYIGLSPKQINRIVRFYNILHHIKVEKENLDFSLLALEYGFFDQSHLIKEFKYFCEKSPKKFLLENESFLQYKCNYFC